MLPASPGVPVSGKRLRIGTLAIQASLAWIASEAFIVSLANLLFCSAYFLF